MDNKFEQLTNKISTLKMENRKSRKEKIALRSKNVALENTNKKLLRDNKKLEDEIKKITKDNKILLKMFKVISRKIDSAKGKNGPELVAELSTPFWNKNLKLSIKEISKLRHAALDYMTNNEQILTSITGVSKAEFDDTYKKFLKRLEKDKNTRQILGMNITQGNICKLLPNHILLLHMVRKHCKSPQMILEGFFKVDQSSISRYLSTTSKHFKD